MSQNEAKTPIETFDPALEPEYVGAHSEPIRETCSKYVGEYDVDIRPCGQPATHTIVEREPGGYLTEIPVCDDCGEPEDAARF